MAKCYIDYAQAVAGWGDWTALDRVVNDGEVSGECFSQLEKMWHISQLKSQQTKPEADNNDIKAVIVYINYSSDTCLCTVVCGLSI